MKKAIPIQRLKLYLWTALAYLLLWVIIDLGNEPDHFLSRILNNIWLILYILLLNFLFFEYVFPFIRRKRALLIYNILLGIVITWIMLMLFSFGLFGWRNLGIGLSVYTSLKTFKSVEAGATYVFPEGFFSLFFFGLIRYSYAYIKLKQDTQQLRIEKQEAELNYLRSQTNPHFLFNTLNNIYSLARDKSDLAGESILRLSKILRFMLYETSGTYIAVEDELKIISDYLALEQLRYDESLRINFNYDIEDPKQSLPPLLLIPLVENAFKHGVAETRNGPFVEIHLSVKKKQLAFFVKNSTETGASRRSVKENIGLSNLRRQLELLYTEYDLSMEQKEGIFVTVLKINLASHVEDQLYYRRR